MVVDCDSLKLVQWNAPDPQPDWQELIASGHVAIEGSAADDSRFYATSQRLTFDSSKELLVLDGGTGDARLWRLSADGSRDGKAVARKIEYWRGSGEVKVDKAKHLDLLLGPSADLTRAGSSGQTMRAW